MYFLCVLNFLTKESGGKLEWKPKFEKKNIQIQDYRLDVTDKRLDSQSEKIR